MAADISPYSLLRPVQPQEGPLDQFGRVLSLKSLMGQNDVQDLQRTKLSRDLQEEEAVRQLYAGATPDQMSAPDFLQRVMGASPTRGIALQKTQLDNEKSRAEIAKTRLEAFGSSAKQLRDMAAQATGDADMARIKEFAFKWAGPQVAATVPDTFSPQWQKQFVMDGDKFIERLNPKATFVDQGSVVQPRNPYTGSAMGGPIPKSATPGEAVNIPGVTFDANGRPKFPANGSGAGSAGNLHGDDYLQTLPKAMGDQVRALAEGRMAFPAGFALKSPYWQNMVSAVSQYDPNFDAVNYNARASTRKDFTSGKSAVSLNALNTVMGHLDELDKAAAGLNNTSIGPLNAAVNAVGGMVSPDLKARLNKFNLTKQAVTDEMERAYRGAGGSQAGIDAWKKTLSDADSYPALRASIQQGVKLLESKINALGDTYSKGMGTTKDGLELLAPHARATFERLLGDGSAAAAPAPGAAASPAAAAPAAPQAFQSLPDPAQFAGRFMTDTTSGLRYQSDGKSWKRAPASGASR